MIEQFSTEGLRVAVVGLGRMGLRHLEAIKRLDMKICGLVDQSGDAAEGARQAYGLGADVIFGDVAAMLADARPQGLVVATTAPAHASLTVAAANAGVQFILCEKPMGVSLAECRRMIEVCASRGAVLAVNHQMRFMPQYTEVKALLGSQALGPLVSILVAGSNFGLAMNASHYFEMFRYLTGRPIDSVQAWLDTERVPNPRGLQFEDRAGRLLARSEGGPSMFIDFSADAGHGLQVVYICKYGQIVVDELSGTMRIIARQAEFRTLPTTRYGMPADNESRDIPPADTIAPTMAVWRAMLAGADYPDGGVGLHAVSCLVAANVSDRAGGLPIRLDAPDLPDDTAFPWA